MQNKLSIIYIHPDVVVIDTNNARGHDDEQINDLMASIKQFGFRDPIEIRPDNTLLAGEGRTIAARRLGLEKIPAIIQSGLDPRESMAYSLTNNKLGEKSFWKIPQLSDNISQLVEMDFDIDICGFSDQEIEGLLKDDTNILPKDFSGRIEVKSHDRAAGSPNSDKKKKSEPVCKLGDVWVLGPNKFIIHEYGEPADLHFFDSLITQWQNYKKNDAVDKNGSTFNERCND